MITTAIVIGVRTVSPYTNGTESSNHPMRRTPHVKFTEVQIQDKEKELMREYRILKVERKECIIGS
jgi:hypothetical protein